MNNFGVVAKGIVCPVIREGDDLVKVIVDNLLEAMDRCRTVAPLTFPVRN